MQTISEITLKKSKSEYQKVKITSSDSAQKYCRQFFSDDLEIYESVFILLLNRSNNTIGYAKISQGGVCGSIVDVKIICKYAIDSLCSSVILCHNHPSGNKQPSAPDSDITRKTKEALKLFDIQLTDHVILTYSDYFSFADNGLL